MCCKIELRMFWFYNFDKDKQGRKQLVQIIDGKRMIKSTKVKKLIDQNGISIENFTMVIRLKKIIQQLNLKIKEQNQTIMSLKRDTKTTKINEMQVQIQHLNDENKRLTLMIQEIKNKYKKEISNYAKLISANSKGLQCQQLLRAIQSSYTKTKKKKSANKKDSNGSLFGSVFQFSSNIMNSSGHKKSYPEAEKQKEQMMKQQIKQKKFQKKYYDLLQQSEKLKKELINLRMNQTGSANKKRKSINGNDRNSIYLHQNMQSLEKITQKKHDLEAENEILKKKLNENQRKSKQLQSENDSVKRTIQQLKAQIKCRNLLTSEKTLTNSKSAVFKDVSNSPIKSNQMTCSITSQQHNERTSCS